MPYQQRREAALRTRTTGIALHLQQHAFLRLPLLSALAAGALFAGAARAESSLLTEDLFLGDLPPVLSATRLPQPLSETPASVTIVDRHMIEASGATTLPDILRLVPGFQVGHIDGHTSVVTYHGLSDAFARRLQVLVDGRSVYTPAFGGVLWTDLPLAIEDIDRIEVIRGPNGVTYGANAFAATVNIITRDPAQDQGTFVKLTHGDVDTNDALLRYGGNTGALRYRVTLGYHEDSGFPETADNKRVSLLALRGDYRPTDRDSIDLQFGYNGGPRGDGTQNDPVDPARDRQVKSSFSQVRWKRALSADNEYQVQFYHNYYRSSDTYRTAPLSQIFGVPPAAIPIAFGGRPDQQINVVEDVRTERYDLEFVHTLGLQQDLRMVWGAETRLDRVGGQGWFNTANPIDTTLYRLFSDLEWRIQPGWIVNAGAMYEHNDITGGDVSPRVALNYRLSPTQTLRTGISRAYRTPSAFESQADAAYRFSDGAALDQLFKATQTLGPEQITAYELGYLGRFSDPRAFVDLRLFHEDIRHIISEYRDTSIPELSASPNGSKTFNNDGSADIDGAEAQFKWFPTTRTQLIFSYAYTHQTGRSFSMVPNQYAPTDSSTPLHTRSLLAVHRFDNGVEGSLAYYKVGRFRFLEARDYAGDYNTVDARLAYRGRLGNKEIEISLVGQNLTGDYYDYSERRVFDKRYFVILSLKSK